MQVNAHDLRLPEWGPYSKVHAGISHIADASRGLRVDFIPVPGLFRRLAAVPSALHDTNVHMWDADPRLSRYVVRHELRWKDRIFADLAYDVRKSGPVISARFVNNTDAPIHTMLNFLVTLRYPNEEQRDARPLVPYRAEAPESAVLLDAVRDARLFCGDEEVHAGMVTDALWPCERRAGGFVDGRALELGVPAEPGGPTVDSARFPVDLHRPMSDATVHIRYRCETDGPLRVRGLVNAVLPPHPAVRTEAMRCGHLRAGTHELILSVGAGGRALVDVIVIADNSGSEAVLFAPTRPEPTPDIELHEESRFAELSFPELRTAYRVRWSGANCTVREILNTEIDGFLPAHVNEHVATRLRGDGGWHFTDFYMHPILIGPNASATVHFELAAVGSEGSSHDATNADMSEWPAEPTGPTSPAGGEEAATLRAGGETYEFSQRLMRAVLLTNVVYPINTRYGYVKHNTPGKWWDSLYTWDSGFTALGLLEIDPERADDCLSAYLTGPEDADALPFLLHGTPLPIQIFVARELWNLHSDIEQLRRLYPGLRRMYDYISGRAPGSPTRPFTVPLIATWKLFYNSGGWDDYPAQQYVHRHGLTDSVAPVVTTALLTRCAKLLAGFASLLEKNEESDLLLRDAHSFEHALQQHAYDPETGYFGYVRFDEPGNPVGILRSEAGENLNRGLDGITPLVAGFLDQRQRELVFSLLNSERHLWTEIGISTVDRSASYFRRRGYWNGAVWMPHQWLLWKSLIDYGRFDMVVRIAQTALELWKRETEDSYNCYEHFNIETGRGAGWHQFGGLSTPVLVFFNALYRIGRVTAGYDVRIDRSTYDHAADSLTVSVVNEAVETRWILASMARDAARSARSLGGGGDPHLTVLGNGLYGLGLPGGFRGDIEITQKNGTQSG